MTRDLIKAKLIAAGIHLGLSLVIFIGVLYLILVLWFPEPFFTAEGGWQGIRLMAFVDLVLGPSLTLIIYNHTKKKKEIITDLSIIAIVQIAALIWGGYTVYSKRPVALVFYDTAFYTVTNDYYEAQGILHPDYSKYSNHIPPIVAVRYPKTEQEERRFTELTLQAIPIYAHDYLYEPVTNQLALIKEKQVDIEEVMQHNPRMKQEIVLITNNAIDEYYYLALEAKFHNLILVLTKEGKIKGLVKAPISK